jgi:hypothetical protein
MNILKLTSLVIGLLLLPIMSYSQKHKIGSTEPIKSYVKARNYKYSDITNPTLAFPYAESIDTIMLYPGVIKSGGSITILEGDIPAIITGIAIKVDTGLVSTPYTVQGANDSVTVCSRYNSQTIIIASLTDASFTTPNGGFSYTPVSSNYVETNSCLYFVKIPANYYINGKHVYTVIYKYMKLK